MIAANAHVFLNFAGMLYKVKHNAFNSAVFIYLRIHLIKCFNPVIKAVGA